MGLKKGYTNNPKGRPRGSKNRSNTTFKQFLTGLIDGRRDQIEADLDSLQPRDRLMMIERLMAYCYPKAQTDLRVNFDQLADAELDAIINHLIKNTD